MNTTVERYTDTRIDDFRDHVLDGLSRMPKMISSRYFYDAEGDRLFQAIMTSPDYYLTRAEDEILREQTDPVLEALANGHDRFSLYELGAGDASKTKHLLQLALAQGRDPLYCPIDISGNVLDELGKVLGRDLPELRFGAIQGEYFEAIRSNFKNQGEPKAVLFLGSNIGNLPRERAIALLKEIAEILGPKDRLLVGFDLKKDPAVILRAYNDREGITRDFNLNLLRRMNTELGADIQLDRFVHAPVYCPATGRALSYIVSTCDQVVKIPGASAPFRFAAWEALHTEVSQKYDQAMIDDLAHNAGLKSTHSFTDRNGYFTDVVFAPIPTRA